MKKIFFILSFLLILAFPIFAANIAISFGSSKPDITVNFVKGDAPYTGPVVLKYYCSSSSGTRVEVVEFTCSNGICKNDQWFSDLTCRYPKYGYFRYQLGNATTFSGTERSAFQNFKESGSYTIILDADTGEIKSVSYATCGPGFFMLTLFLLVMFARKSL